MSMSEKLGQELNKAIYSFWDRKLGQAIKLTEIIYQPYLDKLQNLNTNRRNLAVIVVSTLGLKFNKKDLRPTTYILQHLASEDPDIFHPNDLNQALNDDNFLSAVTHMTNQMHLHAKDATKKTFTKKKVKDTLQLVSNIVNKSLT